MNNPTLKEIQTWFLENASKPESREKFEKEFEVIEIIRSKGLELPDKYKTDLSGAIFSYAGHLEEDHPEITIEEYHNLFDHCVNLCKEYDCEVNFIKHGIHQLF